MVPLTVEGSSVAFVLEAQVGPDIWLNIGLTIALIILLAFSAFFSSAETAYSSVNIIRLKNYQEEKRKGAKRAVYIAEKFDLTLTTILIGNNFVNIGATTIAAFMLSRLIENATLANILNTLVMTVIVLIFGEIMPKSYAKERSEKVALKISGPLFVIMKILWPLSFLFIKLRKLFVKNTTGHIEPYMTENELESIIDVMEDQGVIGEQDADLITNAININDRTVYDIMTPRVDMVSIDVEDSNEVIRDTFFEFQFSRLPVYREDKDNIIGIISERDYFTAIIKANNINDVNINDLITEPYFVSKSTKVDELIREMQLKKKHFAIVSDEYGGTSGIVTLEDALEELVGEIYDEYDEIENQVLISKISDNTYLLSPEIELEELYDELDLGKAPESEYSNIGGFIYSLCDGLPSEGKIVEIESIYEDETIDNPIYIVYNLKFEIKEVQNRRIRSILLTVTADESSHDDKKSDSKHEDKKNEA